MKKGKLIYETPRDSIYRRLFAFTVIGLGGLFGIILGNLLMIFLLTQASIILGTQAIRSNPTIHKKVVVYKNGITRSLSPIRVLFSPSSEGSFIPFITMRAFERGRTKRRCIIYLHGGTKKIVENAQLTDPRRGVLKPIFRALERNGIPEVEIECPHCRKETFYLSETCYKCGYDRFEPVESGGEAEGAGQEDSYYCESCTTELDYIDEYDRWYCPGCEEYQ